MQIKSIARVSIDAGLKDCFDYFIPENLRKFLSEGMRVRVIFNNKKTVGFIHSLTSTSEFKKLNPILEVIDEKPLFPKGYLAFLNSCAEYYCSSLSSIFQTAVPVLIRKGQALPEISGESMSRSLNEGKSYVCRFDNEDKKKEFYFSQIEAELKANRQVIIVFPALRPLQVFQDQLNRVFKDSKTVVLHSHLNQKEALKSWILARNQQADIVLGLRGAVFAPLNRTGLIIIDEEDNSSYKQETSPYYHAREVAWIFLKHFKCRLVLSSISLSCESFAVTKSPGFEFVDAGPVNQQPRTGIYDIRALKNYKKEDLFAFGLLSKIRAALEAGKKVLIFYNRKGFATFIRCRSCNFTLSCSNCSANLVFEYDKQSLSCPYCNYKTKMPLNCPSCHKGLILFSGLGTERIESEANRIFAGYRIACIDNQSKETSFDNDILISGIQGISTQFLKAVETVAVISLDNILNQARFRSTEDTFRILMRLKSLAVEELLVQTYYPQHRVFKYIKDSDYIGFMEEELAERKALKLPPFTHLISVQVRAQDEQKAVEISDRAFIALKDSLKDIEVFEPIEEIPFKLRGNFRLQILIKTAKLKQTAVKIRPVLQKVAKSARSWIHINVDV